MAGIYTLTEETCTFTAESIYFRGDAFKKFSLLT